MVRNILIIILRVIIFPFSKIIYFLNKLKKWIMEENNLVLGELTNEQRKYFIKKLIMEQVIAQRNNLHFWRDLTNQPAQIDTGYIAQHLVSIITGIKGGGFRGKGDDLEDGSEVKSANFLDSLDKAGAVAPRWNFMCNDKISMESLIELDSIYLVSIDFNTEDKIRFRVWEINPKEHEIFTNRYKEWMDKLGYPKLEDPKRPGVNFQLFPPKNKSNDTFARHGNGREDGFERLQIQLEGVEGAKLLFLALIENEDLNIITFNH
jgi:hypothetical protein